MVMFQNKQWAVTDYGIECLPPDGKYDIKASRLTETTERGSNTYYDWPVHLAEKAEWVDIEAFIEAFSEALVIHKDRYGVPIDDEMLQASILKARHDYDYAKQYLQKIRGG